MRSASFNSNFIHFLFCALLYFDSLQDMTIEQVY